MVRGESGNRGGGVRGQLITRRDSGSVERRLKAWVWTMFAERPVGCSRRGDSYLA